MVTYEEDKTSRSEGTQSVVEFYVKLISPRITLTNIIGPIMKFDWSYIYNFLIGIFPRVILLIKIEIELFTIDGSPYALKGACTVKAHYNP